jgi:membrane protein involved in colicin uptake
MLFNIARAEAKLGHDENAIAFLRRYLEERPNADDAPAVLAEIEAREKALAAARDKAEADRKKAAAEAEAAEVRRRATEEAARRAAEAEAQRKADAARADAVENARLTTMKRAGISLVVIGPVVAAVGIGLGVAASRAADEITSAAPGTPFAGRYADVEARGRAFNQAGIALDVIGGVAAAIGVGLVGYAYSRKAPAGRAWLLLPTGHGVAIGGAF